VSKTVPVATFGRW